jgi:hypothetical protein
MMAITRFLLLGSALVTLCISGAPAFAKKTATQAKKPPAQTKLETAVVAMSGRIMTKAELTKIYSGKTWHWPGGEAYFNPNQRFNAWAKTGLKTTYGEGFWSAANNGQLCISAAWHSLSGNTNAFTCYIHRIGSAIYQRELPHGSWYLFSHLPPQPADEIYTLEPGDHITDEYLRARKYVLDRLPARGEPEPNPKRLP